MKKVISKSKKIWEHIKNEKLWLLIILIFLAVFFKINRVEISFGIKMDFSGIFLILILFIFGFKKALITTIAIILGYVFLFNGEHIQFIDVLKIVALNIFSKRKWKLNIIIREFIFWGIFILPMTCGIILFSSINELREYYYFVVLFLVVNGILNAFLAEVIFVYLIKEKIHKEKVILKYREIILHIVTLAILIPFIINVIVDLDSSYKGICNTVESTSGEIYHYVEDELEFWNEKSITNLQLTGTIEVGKLEAGIRKSSRYKPYNIHIVDKTGNIILDVKNHDKEILKYEDYNIYPITENLYKLLPINEGQKYFNNSWADGYFIYTDNLESLGLPLMVEVPNSIYNDRIVEEYLRQFKFLIFFTLFIAIISNLLNRTIFNSLYELSITTKNLPEKLKNNIDIKWPDSKIYEIGILKENIENTSCILRENFIELNETQKKLYELAYYDVLTKLPNRVFFKNHLEKLIEDNNKVAVIFIDLDRFKSINDTWGHDIGDKLLIEVAKRFTTLKNKNCNIFRLGGDEFVLVVNVDNIKDIKIIGDKIVSTFNKDFKINDLIIPIKCSMGASIYPTDSTDIDTIIKYADIAMYTSKENGGNYIQLFNDEINERVIEKIAIEEGINKALEKNQFLLYYQPKFSGEDGEIKSLEALIRWENGSMGIIFPDKFIPIAEESDLIFKIDRWVIFEACKINKKLQNEGYKKIPISVNVSARHFVHRELLEVIEEALEKSKLNPKYLKIEITEGVFIKNIDIVSNIIIELEKLGVQVSIDDFGKGYSSINQLMSLPIREVKIDRDFIKNINKDMKKKNIVKLIVELAHSLELNVVAEGIEIEEEKIYLESIGCDELQGYLFSKPVKINELKNFF